MAVLEKPAAAAKLRPSKLTEQLEGLGADIDVKAINLDVKGRVATRVREAIVDATLTRTVEGASTLELNILDRDLAITNSGVFGSDSLSLEEHVGTVKGTQVMFGKQVDCELDGLWFRMVAWSKPPTSRVLTVTFEDREVALLRSYPRPSLGQPLHRAFDPSMTRIQVMLALIAEVREVPIRVVAPMFTGNDNAITASAHGLDKTSSAIAHQPGFASFADVTVKGQKATKLQRDVIEAVLLAGSSIKHLPRALLTTALMVITAESDAGASVGFNAHAVGPFQQDPAQGWPATGDPTTDAQAFYTAALTVYQASPSLDLALIAALVQKPKAFLDSGDTSMYGRWRTEAEHTVNEFLGLTDVVTAQASASPYVPTSPAEILHGQFVQGSVSTVGSKTVVSKESNWAMLQRLAQEVGWWCYVVSGTAYIEDPEHLFQQRPRFVFDEDTDGVDGVGVDLDTGKKNAVVTVQCRSHRWQAPPGTVGQIRNTGPANGRWIVTTIERGLFGHVATITHKKPQRPLADAEAAVPVIPSGIQTLDPAATPKTSSQTTGVQPPLKDDPTHGFLPAGASYTPNRADQGRDFQTNPGGAIIAPGDGHVVDVLRDSAPDGGFGPSYPVVFFKTGYYAGKTLYIGHNLSALVKGATFVKGTVLSHTGTTGQETWNGNASQPGWAEIGFAPFGTPGPFGQTPPF